MRALISANEKAAHQPACEHLSSRLPRVLVLSCLAFGSATPVLAQRWTFEPSIETQATLTNNANFDSGSQRESDLVFNVLPAIRFSRDGPRLRLDGSAGFNLIGYADGTQTSRILPQANVLANLEAIEQFFFVEAALLANQDVLNPFLSQSDSASTFNKYTYVQGRVSPYLQGNFGPDWRYLVRSDNSYTHTTQSGSAQLADSYYGRHFAEVIRVATPLGGSLRVQSDVTRFDDQTGADQHIELALAKINYAFTPHFNAGLRGGYERTNYTLNDTSGAIYGAEFGWTPNARTRLAGFWESRFFGPSYRFDLTNRQRSLATNLSASRSVTTYPQLVLQLPGTGNVSGLLNAILIARFPDPVERARQVRDLIDLQALPSSLPNGVNIYSQSVNVVTSGSASAALIGLRNTLALTLYYTKTDLLPDAAIPPTFITFNNNIQKGATLSLSHRLSRVMTLNAIASRLETRGFDQSAGNVTDQNIFEVQTTRQLSPRSSAFIGARYQQQESTSSGVRDANEAAIFVGLFHRL